MEAALRTKQTTVRGTVYEFTMLGADEGQHLWLKLLQLGATPMRVLSTAGMLDEETIGEAVAATLLALDKPTTSELTAAFKRRCAVVEGENRIPLADCFDLHFAGRYLALSTWLLEGALFNFGGDFLGDTSVGAIVAKLKAAAASRSKSRTDSTGSSGVSSSTSAPQ